MSSRRSKKRHSPSSDATPAEPNSALPPFAQPAAETPSRKTLQLCRQVERALGSALADCHDDVLRDLLVESVEPAPNAARLLVTVRSLDPTATLPDVLIRLEAGYGHLRSEIATAINRKRVPELAFQF